MEWSEIEAALKYLAPPFPYAAVNEARKRWDEWAPRFIATIERIAQGGSPFLDDEVDEYDGMICYATWMAAEKRDSRAYAPLVGACHCPRERADELFGDDLTEGLGRQLASVCAGDIEPLKALAEDRDATMWCRYAGIHAMWIRVIENDGDREKLLDWLERFCEREAEVMQRGEWDFEREPLDLLTWAADLAGDIGPSAALLEKIRGWFDEGLIDPGVSGLSYFEDQAVKSAEECQAEARDKERNRYVRNCITDMEWWECFRENRTKDSGGEHDVEPDWLDRIMPAVSGPNFIHDQGTFRRDVPKVGRNDPCPCGSGRKFKKCCGKEGGESTAESANGSSAVRRSVDWLTARYEDAMRDVLHDMLTEGLDDEDEEALADLDEGVWQMIQTNALEWLLAEGEIWLGDRPIAVSSLLLGPKGPPFSASERRWIEQLASRSLRLYDVTETVPGVRMTLCDALDLEASPVVVLEKSGSCSALVGMKLAARIVTVGEHHELSGAVYPFSELHVSALLADLREDMENFEEGRADELPEAIAETIRWHWLTQYLRPAPLPSLVDTHSGELLLFVIDRYRVLDWEALVQALALQDDIDGDRDSGWSRIMTCADGAIRRRASINPESEPDTLEVSYRTQRYADEGRPWFETVAGKAVEYLGREIKDPKVSMMLGAANGSAPPTEALPELPPEALAEAIEQVLRRSYANWADEALPALGTRTPRQAIATPAGLERVKGLLRSYAANEKRMAAEQGRREISFDFLWESLGLRRG